MESEPMLTQRRVKPATQNREPKTLATELFPSPNQCLLLVVHCMCSLIFTSFSTYFGSSATLWSGGAPGERDSWDRTPVYPLES